MYQRMLTAEQRLKNEHYPFQERWVSCKRCKRCTVCQHNSFHLSFVMRFYYVTQPAFISLMPNSAGFLFSLIQKSFRVPWFLPFLTRRQLDWIVLITCATSSNTQYKLLWVKSVMVPNWPMCSRLEGLHFAFFLLHSWNWPQTNSLFWFYLASDHPLSLVTFLLQTSHCLKHKPSHKRWFLK